MTSAETRHLMHGPAAATIAPHVLPLDRADVGRRDGARRPRADPGPWHVLGRRAENVRRPSLAHDATPAPSGRTFLTSVGDPDRAGTASSTQEELA